MRIIEAGLDTTGDDLIGTDLITSGAVLWVDSENGNDSNSGSRELPLATLAAAITEATASNGDIIVIESGHSETLTSAITVSKAGLKIFGLGSGSEAPNFLSNAAIDLFDITAANVELNNLYFLAATTATATAQVNVAADSVRIKGCTFLCGAYTQNVVTVTASGTNCRIESCAFTVTADGPDGGVLVESASAVGLYLYDCTFDGGTYNWDNAAVYSTVAHTNFIYDTVTFSNNAKLIHTSSSAKGICSGLVVAAGGEVSLA